MSKKYPISQKVSLSLFDRAVSTEEELSSVLGEKYNECILGRISFIIRTISPEEMSVDTPGLEIAGIPVKGVSKKNDGINLNVDNRDMESLLNDDLDEEELIHICHYLEKRFVAPSARFCPDDPFEEFQEDEEDGDMLDLPPDIIELVHNICVSADRGDPEDVCVEILSAAASILACNEDPEAVLQTFVNAARHISEDDDSSFAEIAERNKILS